jgi:RNA-directed DNA polymerase
MERKMQLRKAVSAVLNETQQGTEIRARWAWVEASVWTDAMLTALENGVKGDVWFRLIDKVYAKKTLQAAWEQVARNDGSHGIDGVSIERFAQQATRYLDELHEALKTRTYQPLAVKRVHIAKGEGKFRPLGIPVVKDRIVQTALKMVIEPIFEREFVEHSYGFRPKRGCKDALREVDGWLKQGYTWVVDADLQSYFDTIPHDKLMTQVERRISDGRVLSLIQTFLKQDIMDEMKMWTPIHGTPQGAVVSPLLANIYLHPLDQLIEQAGMKMVRYADDFVILCRNEAEAQKALSIVQDWTQANELTLHPDKTHVGNCMEKGQGFEFLGYRFEAGKRWVRKKSLKAFKDKVRQKTKRNRGNSLQHIIQDLKPMSQGWFNYFKHAHKSTFKSLDSFVRRRLRSLRYRQETGVSTFGRSRHLHQRYNNAYFANLGLFTMYEAHRMACQSR